MIVQVIKPGDDAGQVDVTSHTLPRNSMPGDPNTAEAATVVAQLAGVVKLAAEQTGVPLKYLAEQIASGAGA